MATDLDTRDDGASIYDASDNAWEPVLGKTVVRALAADGTAVNNSTTLVSQTGLSTPIAANETRVIRYELIVSAAAAADVDIAVSAPTGATGDVRGDHCCGYRGGCDGHRDRRCRLDRWSGDARLRAERRERLGRDRPRRLVRRVDADQPLT